MLSGGVLDPEPTEENSLLNSDLCMQGPRLESKKRRAFDTVRGEVAQICGSVPFFATSNKCVATSNKGTATSNTLLLVPMPLSQYSIIP